MATRVHRTVRTDIPSRLDRLPWSGFHWRVVLGLGTVWVLDGLEVTIVGAIAPRLTEPGSGIGMTAADVGTAAAIYVAGACLGALVFGQLTDQYGRKRLFMTTLALYTVATVATAFATETWFFFLCRFFTGAGIGGEYSSINSAIDELIPARNRGQVDLTVNGSYWMGAGIGGIAALPLLDTTLFAPDTGWRLAFAAGGLIAIAIMVVRREIPESPRWLFIHGREKEAERIVARIEARVRQETGADLPEPEGTITVRQRRAIPFREIVVATYRRYPRRALLGLSLFVGQAFLYNAVTFDLGTILTGFFAVDSARVPYFMVLFAAGNFLGPLLLGRLFDTVGRKPMITGTYFGSAAIVTLLGVGMNAGALTTATFMLLVALAFFVASAGASSAYLTVSEIFPLETRALAIALFFAVGTAIGGITGPAIFGQFIHSGQPSLVATGFFIGAAVMALGGVAELRWGVRAERQSLENIATPLTAEEAEATPEQAAALVAERERLLPEEKRRATHERSARVAERTARREQRERRGPRRYRPGPTGSFYSPGMVGTAGTPSRLAAASDEQLDHEVEVIDRALRERGPTDRDDLARRVGAKHWGPGRFAAALREAVHEGRARRLSRNVYGPSEG